MISYDDSKKLFKLDGSGVSYVFMIDEGGFPYHLYYGPELKSADAAENYQPVQRAFSPGSPEWLSRDITPQEFSTTGVGDYRVSSVLCRTAAGHNALAPKYRSHRIFKGKLPLEALPSSRGTKTKSETLDLVLADDVAGLEFHVYYTTFADAPVIARSVKVVNTSKKTVTLEKIASSTVDFADGSAYDLISFPGAWAQERIVEREALTHGVKTLRSRRGYSGHQMNPAFLLAEKGADETHGRIYGQILVYSGCFSAEIECDQYKNIRTVFGIDSEDFRWQLEAGGSFQTPEVLLMFSDAGLEKFSHVSHDFFRAHILRGKYVMKERPVLINNWEATYFDFTEKKLLKLAKTAASLGIEMLVLDDGWFRKRNDDKCSLGDWVVNRQKLPSGIAHLAKKINDLGLKFGLWFEPEMVSPDSDLYRAHPDWALHVPGRTPSLGRSQLVLDLSRKEVVDYLFESLSKVLAEANIEYVKWDANRHLSEIGSAALPPEKQGEVLHRYMLGFYDLNERLLKRFPNLLLEGCSGGGGRFDAGILCYAPQIWTSDDSDAVERLKIQYGTSFFYPYSSMGAHVSACPNHQVGRTTPFETRAVAAMAGTFGYELDPDHLPEEEKRAIPEQIRRFHRVHHLVTTGDLYRLTDAMHDPVTAWSFVAKDRSEFTLSAVRVMSTINAPDIRLRLRGIDAQARYADEDGNVYYGEYLMNAGLLLFRNVRGDAVSFFRHFRKKQGGVL